MYSNPIYGRIACGKTTVILRRYLTREVLATTLAVTLFVLMLSVGSRLVGFVGLAAQGGLEMGAVFKMILYRLPFFLILIFPLGFFIALMLVQGRLYVDHEMDIIRSSGMSSRVLAGLLFPLVVLFFVIQSFGVLYLAPAANLASERFDREVAFKSAFELVRPKSFVSIGNYNLYVESFNPMERSLEGVILIERRPGEPDVLVRAKRAEQAGFEAAGNQLTAGNSDLLNPNQNDNESGTQAGAALIDLYSGQRFEAKAGSSEYNVTSFDTYRIRLENVDAKSQSQLDISARSTAYLWGDRADPEAAAELGFRFCLPFMIPLAWMLAVPLSRVHPRQGRWLRLLPSIMIYASSVIALMAIYAPMSEGRLSVWWYLLVMGVYVLISIFAYNKNNLKNQVKRWGAHKA